MRNIFNSFTGSFFRTIGRVLAYVAIGLVVAYFAGFINIGNVKAATITVPNNEFSDTSYAYFTNCVSSNNCWNYISATTNYTSGNFSYWLSGDVKTVSGGSGVGLTIHSSNGFIAGNYYTVSVLVSASATPTANTNNTTIVGTNTSVRADLRPADVLYKDSQAVIIDLVDSNGMGTQWAPYGALLSYTFKVNTSGNYIFLTMTTLTTVTDNWEFYGYSVTSQGSSAPTVTEIQNALSQNFTNITNSITNAQNSINSNINDMENSINNNIDDMKDKQDQTNEKLDDLNNNITDTDTSGSEDLAGGFFDDFDNEDYGLSDIITMPLQVINNITSATCSPLELPLPFVDTDVTLPCMYDIYEDHFGSFLTIYQTITFGIVAYWVCINIFRMVKNFKNPDNDEVEVLDL